MYKEECWYILRASVYTVLGIVVITFKRFQENKNLLQFKPFKFSTVIKIYLVDIIMTVLLVWLVLRGFDNFKNLIENSFFLFF